MQKLLNFLDKTELKTKIGKFYKSIYFVFLPITYFMEYLLFKYYWHKIIIPELLTNDNIVKFFDDNEFGYKNNKIYKMDIVEENHIFQTLNMDEMTIQIRKEFTNSIVDIISKNCSIDIENYINLTVSTDIIITDNKNLRKYTVTIRYYRYLILKENLKYLIIWLILAMISLGMIYYMSHN